MSFLVTTVKLSIASGDLILQYSVSRTIAAEVAYPRVHLGAFNTKKSTTGSRKRRCDGEHRADRRGFASNRL